MPCLNEARTVGRCVHKALEALDRLGICGEVVVADNGSSDGSQGIALTHGARVVTVARKGYGSALQGGIAAARGRFVIMGDADDSYDFSDLGPFVERLRQGDELVMGNRFKGGIRPGAMPWLHRYVGNPVLTGILNLFFRTPIGDAHCGLRGFRKDSCQKLRLVTEGMEFASEMVVKAALHGLHMSEVPVVLHPDGRDRPPHLRSFRDGWRHLRFLLLMSPRWLYLIPALFFFLCGAAWAVLNSLSRQPLSESGLVFDLHTLLLACLGVVLGYQTFWLWILAKRSRRHAPAGSLPLPPRWLEALSLERGLTLGLVTVLAGLGVTAWAIFTSLLAPPESLQVPVAMRYALAGTTLLLVGVQTIYGSFFLGTLGLAAGSDPGPRGTAGEPR